MEKLINRTFGEIAVGDSAQLVRTLTNKDILAFAGVSGDVNPAHLDHSFAAGSVFHDVIGHGLWTGALISTLLGTQLPGPGTIYVSQSLRFLAPVKVGATLTVTVTVIEKKAKGHRVILECLAVGDDDRAVLKGEAEVMAPTERVEIPKPPVPSLILPERGERLLSLIEQAKGGMSIKVGVVHPTDVASLGGALDARDAGLIEPVLIGPRARIEAAAEEGGFDISGLVMHDTEHSHASGDKGAELASTGEVQALLKGALHTDEILGPVLERKHNLRTERRLSHIYVMDAPSYPKLLLITDAAVNISPNLPEKADIIRNAIDLAKGLGVELPKVAILSAIETVNDAVPSTLEAAALCKMADRQQIVGGLIDGPLAFDNAISPEAVTAKGIVSPVAGEADVLVAPNLEAGNMIAKQLDYLGGAVAAGIVLGARVPVILTSRAEGRLPRLASCAVAQLYQQAQS